MHIIIYAFLTPEKDAANKHQIARNLDLIPNSGIQGIDKRAVGIMARISFVPKFKVYVYPFSVLMFTFMFMFATTT